MVHHHSTIPNHLHPQWYNKPLLKYTFLTLFVVTVLVEPTLAAADPAHLGLEIVIENTAPDYEGEQDEPHHPHSKELLQHLHRNGK